MTTRSDLEFSTAELMTVQASRLLQDGDRVLVGVGLPNLACNLAIRTHAPNLVMIYESGVIGARPDQVPLSIGDPNLVRGALAVCSMFDLFALYLQRGHVNVGFLGGAQIDRFGNINATVIGPYNEPKVRLPGSGGAMEIAAWADKIYVVTPHQKRRFPAEVDFITSAGRPAEPDNPRQPGLNRSGLQAVVTDLGILRPNAHGELALTEIHPGVAHQEVVEQTGWPLKISADLKVTDRPSARELEILRSLSTPS